jgi:hypothetical protein
MRSVHHPEEISVDHTQASLEPLEGYAFPVLASVNAGPQVQQIAARCEEAHSYLSDVLDFTPRFRLLVLSRSDWATHAGFPLYGMPHTARGEDIVVGTEPAEFWQGVIRMLGDSPAHSARLEPIHGMRNGQIDMGAFADLIAIHELGHLYHEQVPFSFPRLWLMELFANLCVHTYLAETHPDLMPVWTTLPEMVTSVPAATVQHRSLNDFERLYVGVGAENYVWYQFRLVGATTAIYDAAGVAGLTRLYQTFSSHNGDVTDAQLVELLEDRVHSAAADVMRSWPTS